METLDFKKLNRHVYAPTTKPAIELVEEMKFVCTRGRGDPNNAHAYAEAMTILYGILWTIKMSRKKNHKIDGYQDFKIPPLEGLWWMDDMQGIDYKKKDQFQWVSMLRLPDYVTPSVFDWACKTLQAKHPSIQLANTSMQQYYEGLCVQVMHKGSYDEEEATIQRLHDYVHDSVYKLDYDSISITGQIRKHHEIYLNDPRRTKAENLKTIIRLPISE